MADVDLQAKLRELLADPTALSSIMNLVSGLSQSSGQPTTPQPPQSQPNFAQPPQSQPNFAQSPQSQPNFAQPSEPQINSGQLSETQPNISINSIDGNTGVSNAANADNTVSASGDSIPVFARRSDAPMQSDIPRFPVRAGGREQGCALLAALKPYLAPRRAEKIDTMIKLMQLTELTRGMLNGRS